jgi:uncharacterized phage-associated protein
MPKDREYELKQGRFKDLVLHVSTVLADDPTFGSTKLNKILYFADTEAYRRLGKPLTGAEYQKNKYGPTAREYLPLVGELENAHYVTVERKMVVDHPQDVVTPTGEIVPNMEQFSPEEREIIDRVIDEFRNYTNTEASDESHKRSAGWNAMNMFQTIPYRTSNVTVEEVDEDVIDYFNELERRTGS